MILAIDIGNTNFTLGVFDEKELIATFRMTTKQPRTSDEYGLFLCGLLEHRGIHIDSIKAIVIASVVPDVIHSFNNAILKYFHIQPFQIGPGTKTGLKIQTDNPKEIGADRIVDAVAAYELYGGPVIVIDFGTATTYDLILDGGCFTAGITAPGIRASARALWQDAARLPEIEIRKPPSILAKETISSMQAGIVYGCIGQTEYIIKKIKEEAGLKEMKTVATGGLGKIIADETEMIDIYNPILTLEGLRIIYQKCKGK